MKPMKPILFNTPMTQAIDEDRKAATRRLVTPQPIFREGETGTPARLDDGSWCFKIDQYDNVYEFHLKPKYEPGDILYVRETWCDPTPDQSGWPILYKAAMPMHWDAKDTEIGEEVTLKAEDYKWRPSIHMPKEAARIFLRVTAVRMERLKEITPEDAVAEGAVKKPHYVWYGGEKCLVGHHRYIAAFVDIWNSTIKKEDLPAYGWDANPWVWVYEFEKISKEESMKC